MCVFVCVYLCAQVCVCVYLENFPEFCQCSAEPALGPGPAAAPGQHG